MAWFQMSTELMKKRRPHRFPDSAAEQWQPNLAHLAKANGHYDGAKEEIGNGQ